MELKRRKSGALPEVGQKNGGKKEQNEWISFLMCCLLPRCCSAPCGPRAGHPQPQRPSLSLDIPSPGRTLGSFLKCLRVSQKAKVCAGKKWAWGPRGDKEYGPHPQGACCQGMERCGPSAYHPKAIPHFGYHA